jgi:hypothetical protein
MDAPCQPLPNNAFPQIFEKIQNIFTIYVIEGVPLWSPCLLVALLVGRPACWSPKNVKINLLKMNHAKFSNINSGRLRLSKAKAVQTTTLSTGVGSTCINYPKI